MWTEMIFCYYLIKCGLQIDLLHLFEHSLCILTAWIMWLIPEWNETLNNTVSTSVNDEHEFSGSYNTVPFSLDTSPQLVRTFP